MIEPGIISNALESKEREKVFGHYKLTKYTSKKLYTRIDMQRMDSCQKPKHVENGQKEDLPSNIHFDSLTCP